MTAKNSLCDLDRWSDGTFVVVCVCIIIALYGNAVNGDFVWDDRAAVVSEIFVISMSGTACVYKFLSVIMRHRWIVNFYFSAFRSRTWMSQERILYGAYLNMTFGALTCLLPTPIKVTGLWQHSLIDSTIGGLETWRPLDFTYPMLLFTFAHVLLIITWSSCGPHR